MLLGNSTLKPQSSLYFETFSLPLHHHLSDPGSFSLFSTLQPKRAFKMQILSGHFPAQKPLGNYYYSQDQVQPPTSDPLPRLKPTHLESLVSTSPTSAGALPSFQVLNPPQGTDSPFFLHRMLPFPAPQLLFTS